MTERNGMRKIKEFIDAEEEKAVIHEINIEDMDRTQLLSLEAMLNRVEKRWYDHWMEKISHKTNFKFDKWDRVDQKHYDEFKKKDPEIFDLIYPELKYKNHNSVWEFFESIGYDYKSNKVSNYDNLLFIEKR